MWLLLVEDEADLSDSLKTGLEEVGYTVDVAFDGVEGEILAKANKYDVIIVDWILPRQDGLTLIQRLRASNVATPVLILTALTEIESRVRGLDAGADDYLTKPFSFEELFARLRALIRRSKPFEGEQAPHIQIGSLQINLEQHTAYVAHSELDLRLKEYALLVLLARRAGTVVTRTIIAERVWGSALGTSDDVINMTVSSLRRKLTEANRSAMNGIINIETVRGVGYRLVIS